MADDSGAAHQPLLSFAEEGRTWGGADRHGAPPLRVLTLDELFGDREGDEAIQLLQQHGVQRLGEFKLQGGKVLARLREDSITTMGADRPGIDVEAEWRRELGADGQPSGAWRAPIPVTAYVVCVRDAALPDRDGLLYPLLRRWQAGACTPSVFALPALQALIDWKWNRYCRRLLLGELAFFLLWLAAFTTWTVIFQDEDTQLTLGQLLQTTRGRTAVAMDALGLLGMAPFLLIEVSTLAAYGRGWLSAWNLLDTLTDALQILIVAMHVGRLDVSSTWLSVLAALQCVLLLFRLQYFSRVFRPTKFAFFDILAMVLRDVRWYLAYFALVMYGFATAFHVLFRSDQEAHPNFSNLGKAMMTMTTWVAGNAELNSLYEDAHNPVAACLLGVAFVFVLATVLSNLLIGLMTNTLEKLTSNSGARMLLSKAQVIDELEATIPSCIERLFPRLYPPFIHVLRVDPAKLEPEQLERLWASMGEEGEEQASAQLLTDTGPGGGSDWGGDGGGAGGQGAEGLVEVKEKLDALMRELGEVKALLLREGGREGGRVALPPAPPAPRVESFHSLADAASE